MEESLKLTIAYDGSCLGGSQRQVGSVTAQGILEDALSGFAGRAIGAEFAGRTDSGVHAAGQVASCEDFRPDLSLESIRRALEPRLGNAVSVIKVDRVPAGFHARHDARWREYRYRIWAGYRSPHIARTAWHRRGRLDAAAMTEAAARLIGTHDFASFIGGGEGVPWSNRQKNPRGTIRTVYRCTVREIEPWWPAGPIDGQGLELQVVADGFLPRMVRGFVGALCDIGRGANEPDWIDELKNRADRRGGPRSAPPHGLVLWRIGYGADRF